MELARALDEKPDASYPDATVTEAGLEGAYRLLGNEAVSADGILAGHYEQTVERACNEEWVVAVHDTTPFQFSGESRSGLGKLYGKRNGFFGHLEGRRNMPSLFAGFITKDSSTPNSLADWAI